MGQQGETLPVDVDILVRVADRCHAFAKALGYRELEWKARPGVCCSIIGSDY